MSSNSSSSPKEDSSRLAPPPYSNTSGIVSPSAPPLFDTMYPNPAPPATNYGAIQPPLDPIRPSALEIIIKEIKQSPMISSILSYVFFIVIFSFLAYWMRLLEKPEQCSHLVKWSNLPPSFNFDTGLKIRVLGNSLSSGTIILKSHTNATGLVETAGSSTSMQPQISLSQSNGSILDIYVPTGAQCVTFYAVVYLPPQLEHVIIDVQNTRIQVTEDTFTVKQVSLKTTLRSIDFLASWQGQNLSLATKHADILLSQPITDSHCIRLGTENGNIHIKESLKAQNQIVLTTSNGVIKVDESIDSTQVKAYTSKKQIQIKNLTASQVELKTSDATLEVEYAYVQDIIKVRTSNADIDLNVMQGNHSLVNAQAPNGKVTIYMPSDFQGTFQEMSNDNKNIGVLDLLDWTKIIALNNGILLGDRYPPGVYNPNYPIGHVRVTNSDALVVLMFRN